MSMTEDEARFEEWYDELERELYDQHRDEAVEEFRSQRLTNYYRKNPRIAVPAIDSLEESRDLLNDNHPSASLVFSVSSIEQFIKVTLIKPVVHGLVHSDATADMVVSQLFNRTGLNGYDALLRRLCEEIAGTNPDNEIGPINGDPLLKEVYGLQPIRNKIIHQGKQVNADNARNAIKAAQAVKSKLVEPMLAALGLKIGMASEIETIAKS